MHKLVTLVERLDDERTLDNAWLQFLLLSERMPGLMREATCRVEDRLYGKYQPRVIEDD